MPKIELTTKQAIAAGLYRLAEATRTQLTEAALEVYSEALAPRTTPQEWDAFTRSVAPRLRFFPKLVELVDALEEFRGRPSVESEATQAYDRVIKAATYTPEGGASWSYREVRDRCGSAAAEAFLEAGGHNAFATTWDEARRRERFLAAYQSEARERPSSRLLPEGASRLLSSGDEQVAPTRAAAAAWIAEIARRAGIED